MQADIRIRNDIRSGDIGNLIRMHGELYRGEYGWDWTFEAYAAETFGRLAHQWNPARERIWIAEREDRIVGCIAILDSDGDTAQLRWFLVDPAARGTGLGRQLIDRALSFCRAASYSHIFLWTMASLSAAAHLYRSCGFEITHSERVERWGAVLTEERYDLELR